MTVLVFLILAIGPLLADAYHRKPEPEPLARAIRWSLIYVASAMAFALYLVLADAPGRASLFLSGYAIEKAMSVDNLIVFAAVFAYFGVRPEYQHRVLYWGIAGSAVLRLLFIGFGLAAFFVFGRLLDLAFGLFVIVTAYKMNSAGDAEEIDHSKRWYIRWTKRVFPVSTVMNGNFVVRGPSRFLKMKPYLTPLFLCLIALEITDIAFAFDSVPAVIGITRNTLLAYSAVMFAVLGLRSMYFVLEALKRYTTQLAKGVTCILMFVGLKMLLHGLLGIEISAEVTLAVVGVCLLGGIILSIGRGPLPSRWWSKV